jgi:oligosaccharide repeat unit polymerase
MIAILLGQERISNYFSNRNVFFVPMLLFASGFFLSITKSIYPLESVTSFLQILFIFTIAYPILSIVVCSEKYVKILLTLLVIPSFLITLVLLLFCFLKIDISFGMFLIEEGWRGRFSYGGMEPNVPARIVLQTIPIYSVLLITTKNKVVKFISILLIIISLFTVIATGSRSGLLTAIFGFIIFLIFYKRINSSINIKKIILSIFLVVALLLMIYNQISPEENFFKSSIKRYSTIFYPSKSESSQERIELVNQGFEYVTKNPVIGLGMSNSYLYTKMSIHNPILLTWVENGILGLIGFLSIYLILIFYGVECWKHRFYNNYLVMGLSVIMFMMVFGDMFMANTYKRVLWLPTLLFVAYSNFISEKHNA